MEQTDLLKAGYGQQQALPNATAVLVLGIIAILGGLCYGLGIISGIIGLVLANKDRNLYNAAPELYTASSYSTLNAGRICSIIGVVLAAIFIVIIIFVLIFWKSIFAAYGIKY